MNVEELQRKLLAVARAHPASDRVPYAFATRIMAQVTAARPDPWGLWAQALWRAVVPCLAVMLLLGAWSFFAAATPTKAPVNDLSQAIDNTVLAAVDQEPPPDWVR